MHNSNVTRWHYSDWVREMCSMRNHYIATDTYDKVTKVMKEGEKYNDNWSIEIIYNQIE